MEDLETWLERVYQADGNHDRLQQLYDEWANDYDQQLWASGNPYIAISTGLIGRHVADYDAKILDAGCGTGNMAQILHQMGYRTIEGLDPSAGMRWSCRRLTKPGKQTLPAKRARFWASVFLGIGS